MKYTIVLILFFLNSVFAYSENPDSTASVAKQVLYNDSKKFYFSITAGDLFFPGTNDVVAENYSYYNYENIYGSYGKGFEVGMNAGYMFTNNIGAEIGFNSFQGNDIISEADMDVHETITASGKMFRISASAKFTFGKRLKPYLKCGLLYGINPEIDFIDHAEDYYEESSGEIKFSDGHSIGFRNGIGIDYFISKRISVNAELTMNFQRWTPVIAELSYTTKQNGVVESGSESTTFDELYKNSMGGDPFIKSSYPFEGVGLSAGVKICVGK